MGEELLAPVLNQLFRSVTAVSDPSATDWLTSIASAVSAAAATAALFAIFGVRSQIKLQRQQQKQDLENVYVVRYWAIMDDLRSSAPRSAAFQRNISRYLRLSEDQCDLRARDRISEQTWLYWRDGIVEQLSDKRYGRALAQEPPALFDHVRQLAQDCRYDPARPQVNRG